MTEASSSTIASAWAPAGGEGLGDGGESLARDLGQVLRESVPEPDAWTLVGEKSSVEALVLTGLDLYRVARLEDGFSVYKIDIRDDGFDLQLHQTICFARGDEFRHRTWTLGDGLDNLTMRTEQQVDSDRIPHTEEFCRTLAQQLGWKAFDA